MPPGASVLITGTRRCWTSGAANWSGSWHARARRSGAASLEEFGALVLVRDEDEAAALADEIAAEHLHLPCDDAARLLAKIPHAGAAFLGHYTPGGGGRLRGRSVARAAHRRNGPLCQRTVGQRFPARPA